MKHLQRVFGFIVALTITAPAFAGIADSPLAELVPGEKTHHLYSVPGVIGSGNLGTYFSCTSTDTATMQVGVELFDQFGIAANTVELTSLSVAPGRTVVFGTDVALGIATDTNLPAGFSRGSARILSTSKKLVCTAFVADRLNDPPQTSWQLTIIAKTKQKAAN